MTTQAAIGGGVVDFQPMSPEEIERTVQFLLRQQAQFAADFERLSVKTDGMMDGIVGLTGIVGHVTNHLGHLTDHLGHVTDRLGDVGDRLDELAAAQERTDQEIRNLSALFERHLREDHGHRPS